MVGHGPMDYHLPYGHQQKLFHDYIDELHPILDIWTTLVPAKMVNIGEKSIKQNAI